MLNTNLKPPYATSLVRWCEREVLQCASLLDYILCHAGLPERHDLIPSDTNVEKLIADGGYYSIELLEKLCAQGILPVIPPPFHAVVHGEGWSEWHDKIVQYIKDKETVYAYYNKYGYNVRSRVEVQFSRIKRCIGESFKTQKFESQKTEGVIISNIINLWNSFGLPTSVKV